MADWSTLPTELIHLLSQKLSTATDLLRFRSVCSSWRNAVPFPSSASVNRFPILPNSGMSQTTWGFHLSRRTIFTLEPTSDHSSSSWIIKLERDKPTRMHLLNPLTRSRFKPLPNNFPKYFSLFDVRVQELGDEYILHCINFSPTASSIGEAGDLYREKVAVLTSSDGGFVLLTVHVSGKLVVFKSGDEKWRVINDMPSPYDDVVLWGGGFYAVDDTGRTVSVNHVDLSVAVVAGPIFGGDRKIFVLSGGELLLVDMYMSAGAEDDLGYNEGLEIYEEFDCFMSERTVKFKVFRLDGDARKWVVVSDLGDRILFVGDNCTFSASASEIFHDGECRGNCVIFVDQSSSREEEVEVGNGVWKSRGIGVFDLESGSIGPIDCQFGYSKMFWPPPDWACSAASIEAGMNQLNI